MPENQVIRRPPKLNKRRALRAAVGMEIALPGMVDYLHDKFYDETMQTTGYARLPDGEMAEIQKPTVSVKEKVIIASFFARTSALKEQVVEEKGLRDKAAKSDNPLIVALGGVAVFKSLPAEKRQELLLKMASGDLQPGEVKVV